MLVRSTPKFRLSQLGFQGNQLPLGRRASGLEVGDSRRDFSLDFGGSDLDLSLGSSSSSAPSGSSRKGAEGVSSAGSGAPGAAPSPVSIWASSSTNTCLSGSGC